MDLLPGRHAVVLWLQCVQHGVPNRVLAVHWQLALHLVHVRAHVHCRCRIAVPRTLAIGRLPVGRRTCEDGTLTHDVAAKY